MSIAYGFSLITISLSLFAAIATLCTNQFTLEILKKHAVWILAAITLAGLMKYPFGGNLFFGLEYEDAYIFGAAARFAMDKEVPTTLHPFLTASCTYGSLVNCKEISIYSGHIIGYSSIIAGAIKIFGYFPQLANYITYAAAILSAGFVFVTAMLMSGSLTTSIFASFIFSTLPFHNLFATASVAEPFSSLFVLLSLFSYLICLNFQPKDTNRSEIIISWSALFLIWLACLLIKRENAIVIALLPAVTLVSTIIGNKEFRIISWKSGMICGILFSLAIFNLAVIDIAKTVSGEVPDVEGFPFSIEFLPQLLPIFLSTMFDWRLFAIWSAMLPITFLVSFRKSYGSPMLWYPIILFSGYLIVYSLHYRGYYFVRTGLVTEFESYRYLANLIPIYSLLAAVGLQCILTEFKKIYWVHQRMEIGLSVSIAIGVLVFSSVQTAGLRSTYSEIESSNRFRTIDFTLDFLRSIEGPYSLLTDDVVLFQLLGKGTEFLIDLRVLGHNSQMPSLSESSQQRAVYYLKKPYHDAPIDKERYAIGFRQIAGLTMERQYVDPAGRFEIFRLTTRSN